MLACYNTHWTFLSLAFTLSVPSPFTRGFTAAYGHFTITPPCPSYTCQSCPATCSTLYMGFLPHSSLSIEFKITQLTSSTCCTLRSSPVLLSSRRQCREQMRSRC